MGHREEWESAGAAWRECFLLAWESFRAGSVPVGAVLTDRDGAIVARGRNRSRERGGDGHIGGSNLAHAEVNALAALPPGEYADHVLYSTLEPCFLCTAALRHSHVGTVRFAAADPIWDGIDRLPELNPHIARRWARREGPLDGPLARLAAVVHLISVAERGEESTADYYATAMPGTSRLAAALAASGADRLRTMSPLDALGTLWPELAVP